MEEQNKTENTDDEHELEELFEAFDRKLEECRQKISDIEKDLEAFRKEKIREKDLP